MGITNKGLERLGELIKGTTTSNPSHLAFAETSQDYSDSMTTLDGEIIRKEVTWGSTGIYPSFSVELNTAEANGYNVNAIGLFDESGTGSGNLWLFDESFIGSKNDTFNAQIEGEIVFVRPD